MSWLEEYQLFVHSDQTVPKAVENQVLDEMTALIQPKPVHVFMKLLGIHFVVGNLTLSICHQFGINPFNTSFSIGDWFMSMWGHNICMTLCGTLFLGSTLFAAGFLLTIEELRTLKGTEIIQSLSLSLVSLGIFAFLGAQIAFSIGALWILGSLVGGFVAIETIWNFRRLRIN